MNLKSLAWQLERKSLKHPSHILYNKVAVVCWWKETEKEEYTGGLVVCFFWFFSSFAFNISKSSNLRFFSCHWDSPWPTDRGDGLSTTSLLFPMSWGWLNRSPPPLPSCGLVSWQYFCVAYYHALTTDNAGNLTPEVKSGPLQSPPTACLAPLHILCSWTPIFLSIFLPLQGILFSRSGFSNAWSFP